MTRARSGGRLDAHAVAPFVLARAAGGLAAPPRPSPCSGDCAADLDGIGDVGFSDLLIVIANWGWCQAPTSPPNEIADCIEKLGTSDPQQLAACIEAMMRLEEGD